MYKVSVCVPIYGAEKYIEKCSVSLFEQTYNNIEYIFVNDCTIDRSIDILETVIDRYPNRRDSVHIIHHEKNRGLSAARNTGVLSASGEFLIHVDADDYLEGNALYKFVEEQKKGDYDMVFAYANRYHYDYTDVVKYPIGVSPHDMTIKILKREIDCYIWGKLIRRSLYFDNNIHAIEGLNSGEDYQVITLLLLYSKSISIIPQVLYHYDFSKTTSESSQTGVWKSEAYEKSYDYVSEIVLKIGDPEYTEAVYVGNLRSLVKKQVDAANNGFREYYIELRERQDKISKKYYKFVERKYIIPLLVGNYTFVRIYIKTLGRLFKYYKRFKYHTT